MRFRGRRDLPLTERGLQQASAVARRIAATVQPAALYASPLTRTMQTARAIGELVHLDVVPDANLIDIDYGRWHGLTIDEARASSQTEIDCWLHAPHLAVIPEGERLQNVVDRAASALRALGRRYEGKTVVAVSHDTVNRVALLHALHAPLSEYWHIEQAPCCINELVYEEGSFRIVRMNDAAHLESLLNG